MELYKYPSSSRQVAAAPVGITEFEILKSSHKFLRDNDEKPSSWNEQLAGKYYSNLYREFAVCDLKHYKSGNFALRWRTETEVLSGAGESTCGNTRCLHHFDSDRRSESSKHKSKTELTTLELPFAYIEHGESKSALVKVVLCRKCLKKLMWKRSKKEQESGGDSHPELEENVIDEDSNEGVRDISTEEDTIAKDKFQRLKKRSREEDEVHVQEKSSRRRRRHSPSLYRFKSEKATESDEI